MTKSTRRFQDLYHRLNKAQREAVEAIEGPVMVVAGPGTGKTLVLTLRLANILRRTDADPENILALTFTEAGANEMRRRLAEIIGPAAYRIEINTFHSFCNDVIQRFPESFPRVIGSAPATRVEQIQILKSIIASSRLQKLRPFGDPLHYLRDVLGALEELKKEDVSPAELEKRIAKEKRSLKRLEKVKKTERVRIENEIAKLEDLGLIYDKYQKTLHRRKLYDFSDMIMEVIRAFEKDKNLLLTLQEQYLYLLADEHQDANTAQNKVLELLAAYYAEPNLFIVGDEKQAIFRFQGASLENFRYFQRRFPAAKIITLTRNYRSTQAILDAADSLIRSREKLRAALKASPRPIRLFDFSGPEAELYFIARDIKEALKRRIKPGEIAVIYRDNKDVLPLVRWLEREEVPYVVESDQDILEDSDIRQFAALFRAVNDYGQSEQLVPATHSEFLGLDPLEVYKLIAGTSRGENLYESLRRSKEKSFGDLSKNLARWASLAKNRGLLETFETILNESGFLRYLLAKGDPLDKLDGLFEEVKTLVEQKRNARLADFIDHLDLLAEHNILIKRRLGEYRRGAVRLMTGHRAKGQEFERVYIINAFDGHWGNRRIKRGLRLPLEGSGLGEADIGDERRLFYVALTRAKKSLTITYARQNRDDRQRLPSQFIAEIDPGLIEKGDSSLYENELAQKREVQFAPPRKSRGDIKNKEFVRALFQKRGFAVTHLNNYLACPWKYFYVDLLQIPRAMNKHQMYGIAAHRALARYFGVGAKEGRGDKLTLLKLFGDSLERQPLAAGDFKNLAERGSRALGGWYDTYSKKWPANVLTEFRIRGVPLGCDVTLTGVLDKIEFLGTGSAVNVVDYKTGRTRSRNEILGKTRNSTGDYRRQLVFYKLLLDRAKTKYRMVSAEIDFIEPTKSGVYKKELFEVSDADTKILEEQVREVAAEILDLGFWNRRCGDKNCEFCALRSSAKQ